MIDAVLCAGILRMLSSFVQSEMLDVSLMLLLAPEEVEVEGEQFIFLFHCFTGKLLLHDSLQLCIVLKLLLFVMQGTMCS